MSFGDDRPDYRNDPKTCMRGIFKPIGIKNIDTSTTIGKIQIMQAWLNKKYIIECRSPIETNNEWRILGYLNEPIWNWLEFEYRIKTA